MISVIVPIFNEINNPYFFDNCQLLNSLGDVELIIIDSNSTDGTLQKLQQDDMNVHQCQSPFRSDRLNLGIQKSTAELIVLLHPRNKILKEHITILLDYREIQWGAFSHQFDYHHPLLYFTSWYSNHIRGDLKQIFYLDHCIFMRRSLAEQVFPLPSIPIFEDTILSQRLKKIKPGKRLPIRCTTSAVRFNVEGVFKRSLQNQWLKLGYFLKQDTKELNKIYEKDCPLNSPKENGP